MLESVKPVSNFDDIKVGDMLLLEGTDGSVFPFFGKATKINKKVCYFFTRPKFTRYFFTHVAITHILLLWICILLIIVE